MSRRDMPFTRQPYNVEIESNQNLHHLNLDPCIVSGSVVDFLDPNRHPVLPPSRSNADLGHHHPPNHHASNIFYGNHGLQHYQPISGLDLGGFVPASHSHYVIPSASRILPMPSNNVSDYTASSSSYGINGLGVDEYGRNHQFMENVRVSSKRKNADGLPANQYYINGSASSSSSSLGAPMNLRSQQPEGSYVATRVGLLEATFIPSEYSGSGVHSITEGPQRSVRSRSSATNLQLDTPLPHHHGHIRRPFQPSSSSWPEQLGHTGSDASWNHGPNTQGISINDSSLEIGLGRSRHQGFQDGTSNRNPGIILHLSSLHHSQHLQAMQSHDYGQHLQMPAPSYRQMTSNISRSTLNLRDVNLDSGSRYSRPPMPSADRIYRQQRRAPQAVPGDVSRHMRHLSSDDVTTIEYSSFYGVGNFNDQHRDMRLDIDDMSYEELLALEERIGDVSVGLSEESISNSLKTRKYAPCKVSSPTQDQSADMSLLDKENCIICQTEYEESERIGVLNCGHDYHVECIKQWLLLKNICPICKATALTISGEDGRTL